MRSESDGVEFSDDDKRALKRVAENVRDSSITRRAAMGGAAALMGGAAFGAGRATAQPDGSPGVIGQSGDRVDVWGDEIDPNSVTGLVDRVVHTSEDAVSVFSNDVSAGDTVRFGAGTHLVNDRIEIAVDDVTVVIPSSAEVKMADGAAPTTISGDNTWTPLIYSTGQSNLEVINRGRLNANNTNHARGAALWFDSCNDVSVWSGPGGIVDAYSGVVPVDSTNVQIDRISSEDCTSLVFAEGCNDGFWVGYAYQEGGSEVVDLESTCTDAQIGTVVGKNTGQSLVEIDRSPGTTVESVQALGSSCATLVEIGTSATDGLSSQSKPSTAGDVTVHQATGAVSGVGINIVQPNNIPANNVHLKGLNIVSTGDFGIATQSVNADNTLDGLTIEGRVESTASGAVNLNVGTTTQQEGMTLDVEVIGGGTNFHGLRVNGWNSVVGRVYAHDSDRDGVFVQATDSTQTSDHWSLLCTTHGNGQSGVDVDDNSSGRQLRCEFFGRFVDGVNFGSPSFQCSVWGSWGSRTDNGTRNTWNGLGSASTSGAPSTGNWAIGTIVEDSANPGNVYIHVPNGGFVQI